jgi:uncharacterized membrane protein
MNDPQKISQIQEELEVLKKDLLAYRQRIIQLQDELNRLQGKSPAAIGAVNSRPPGLENFIGLKLIHLVGIVVLVIGLSISVKYAIDKQLITEWARILLAYVAGIVLYGFSFMLRKKYQLFSAILFSGGMASFYFTTYAAFVYYGFFPFPVAFALMLLFTVFTIFEAIRYNRQEIAILGMVGAYGIPLLISANAERVDLFFSYMTIINLGIVFLSYRKKWELVGQIAMAISWIFFLGWSFNKYQAANFSMAFTFLLVIYFLFMANAMINRVTRKERLSLADVREVLVNNLALYLGALLIFSPVKIEDNIDSITGVVALWVTLSALLTYVFFPEEVLLQKTIAMQAVILIVMFIGFALTGLVVTLLWMAFAVVLFSWGMYSNRAWPRLASIMLMGVTLAKLIIFDSLKFNPIQKIIAYLVIGTLLLVLSFLYQKYKGRIFGKEKGL